MYRLRRPEKTVLFETIKRHQATWYKEHESAKGPVPRYIFNEFQKYLGCGILAEGFACAHCEECRTDFLIAFSCKGRGICLSCNTRAMVETAAYLVENVLPRRPFRQFVISFPMRIRHYLQTSESTSGFKNLETPSIKRGATGRYVFVHAPHQYTKKFEVGDP